MTRPEREHWYFQAVIEPPPLPLTLIHQEQPGLSQFACQSCNGTGRTYRSRFASRTAPCDECAGQGVIYIPEELFDGGGAA